MARKIKVKPHWSVDPKYVANRAAYDLSMAKQNKAFDAIKAVRNLGKKL